MLKKKTFFSSALSICLLGAVVVPSVICASSDASDSANTSSIASKNAGKSTISNHVITPQKSRDVFDDTFDRKDPVSRFVLDPGYGHLKIFAKNRGSSTITFSLVHTDSGKQYIVKTIGAHKKLLWESVNSFSQGLRSENYEIQWRANGDIVHVTTWGVSGTGFANTSTTATQDAGKTTTGVHVITPQATDGQIVDRPVAGFNNSADFDIKPGYGYVRLYLRNTGNTTISFTVNQGSVSGAEKYSASVKPGKTFDEILNSSKPWSAGKFYVSLSSGAGSMSGKLGVRTSSNTDF
ncbi:hypothetical protein [Paenibacillus peoriae]|uniref:hypothetical protein n=1 Tax=Paenibacillus peoriae TaxID=59893 RepID=UPI0021165644|nr:hypothetical protein [Paenibacillus peoriae]